MQPADQRHHAERPNDGGPVSFDNLFIFQDTINDTYCQYELTETPVAGFTGAYVPTAPYSFLYVRATQSPVPDVKKPRAFQGGSPLAVVLTNVAAAAPVSTTPKPIPSTTAVTPTKTVSSSASSSPVSATTSAPIACGDSVRGQYRAQRCPGPISNSDDPASTSTSPGLANTGPSRPIRPSLYLGVGLCLLGVVLLFAGRRRPRGEHS